MAQKTKERKRWAECSAHPEKQWSPLPGYEAYARISSCGDIVLHARPTHRGTVERFDPPRLLPQRTWEGYWAVEMSDWCPLWDRGRRPRKRVTLKIHALVLRAFVGEPPASGMLATHRDGNTHNPHLENLRWGSPMLNAWDRHAHGTCACLLQPCLHADEERMFLPSLDPYRQEIYEAVCAGELHHIVAERYGISATMVGRIWQRYKEQQV